MPLTNPNETSSERIFRGIFRTAEVLMSSGVRRMLGCRLCTSPYISIRPDFDAAAGRIMEEKKRTEWNRKDDEGEEQNNNDDDEDKEDIHIKSSVLCLVSWMMDDFAVGMNIIR